MDHFEDMKAMYAAMSAQSFLLNELYAELFAGDPEARRRIPESLLRATMFRQHSPIERMDEDTAVDIQAQVVLNVKAFFDQVEARLRAEAASFPEAQAMPGLPPTAVAPAAPAADRDPFSVLMAKADASTTKPCAGIIDLPGAAVEPIATLAADAPGVATLLGSPDETIPRARARGKALLAWLFPRPWSTKPLR